MLFVLLTFVIAMNAANNIDHGEPSMDEGKYYGVVFVYKGGQALLK